MVRERLLKYLGYRLTDLFKQPGRRAVHSSEKRSIATEAKLAYVPPTFYHPRRIAQFELICRPRQPLVYDSLGVISGGMGVNVDRSSVNHQSLDIDSVPYARIELDAFLL